MKIKYNYYKQSITGILDELYYHVCNGNKIDYVELSNSEYIQFLEELGPEQRRLVVYLGVPHTYKGIVLKVLSA